jgi:hypothetical protein
MWQDFGGSDNLGENWHFITKGLGNLMVAQVAIAPSNSNMLYVATGAGVYYSINGGDSWQKADDVNKKIAFRRPENYRSIAVNPKNPANVCVGTSKREVYCSANYGQNWTKLNTLVLDNKPIPSLQFNSDGTELFVAFKQKVAKYIFKNSIWQTLGEFKNITDMVVYKGGVYVADQNRVSLGNGVDTRWNVTNSIPKGNAYRLAFANEKIYVGWLKDGEGGVTVSGDAGQSWKNLNENIQVDSFLDPTRLWTNKISKFTALKINPFDFNVIFRSDFWGVWRSDNAGLVWNEKIKGTPNTVGSALTFDSDGNIYSATMDNGLLRSLDSGNTYNTLFPKDKYKPEEAGHVWDVVTIGKNDIVATSSLWSSPVNQVIVSHDAGKTFKIVHQGLPIGRPKVNTVWSEGYPRSLAIDPQNPLHLYLGIDGDDGGGLFVSYDGGESWQRSAGQPASLRIYHGLAVDPTNPNVVIWGATGTGGGVYLSKDKGLTFTQVFKSMSWVFKVAIDQTGKIYAGGDSSGATLYVADSSQKPSFRLLKHFTDGAGRTVDGIAINPKDPKIIAVSTVNWSNSGPCIFYLTRDAGKTWDILNGDLPDGSGAADMIFDSKGEYLYISRYAGSVYKIKL